MSLGSARVDRKRKRLVCVVEGRGEVYALPNLCARIFNEIGAHGWLVDQEPVKQPRSRLVDERVRAPNRPPRTEYLIGALEIAARRPADAVLVICDADDDCAATWAPAATGIIRARIAGAAVMAVREFEAWILASKTGGTTIDAKRIDEIRDAKRRLRQFIPGYKPTVHQLGATRELGIASVRAASPHVVALVPRVAIEVWPVQTREAA